jgi:hypothetical protein
MRLLTLLLGLLLLPGSLWAQEESARGEPFRAQGTAAFLVKASSVAEADRLFMGGWAGLTLGDRILVAGGGMALTKEVELSASEANTGFELGMGYGGVLFQLRNPITSRLRAHASILAGAGHAEVRDRLTGREVGADNFGVLEPEIGVGFSLLPWLQLNATVGRRLVWWVEDLPLVQAEDLRGMTGALSLQVGGH